MYLSWRLPAFLFALLTVAFLSIGCGGRPAPYVCGSADACLVVDDNEATSNPGCLALTPGSRPLIWYARNDGKQAIFATIQIHTRALDGTPLGDQFFSHEYAPGEKQYYACQYEKDTVIQKDSTVLRR